MGQRVFNDQALAVRVEQAIATERSTFADGMAKTCPDTEACWAAIAGGRAIFTGKGFFSNRALGLGVTCEVVEADVARVERFYAERGLPASIEIASMVERTFIDLLMGRGYQLVRFHNIYAQELSPAMAPQSDGRVAAIREVGDAVATRAWSDLLLDGFGYAQDADRERVSRWNGMLRSLNDLHAFVAEIDARAVGAASVLLLGDTAVLGGAATLPAYRRRGVQQALIRARLALAARAGCSLAVVTADPGSSSGRNTERTGFRLVNTHAVLRRGRS